MPEARHIESCRFGEVVFRRVLCLVVEKLICIVVAIVREIGCIDIGSAVGLVVREGVILSCWERLDN